MNAEEENDQTTPPSEPDHAAALATAQAERDEARDQLAASRTTEAAALAATRDAIRAANPGIPPVLIDGGTLAELTASVDHARTIGDQFKALASTNGHSSAPHVPLGTTPSPPPVLTSSIQKIQYGLEQRRNA